MSLKHVLLVALFLGGCGGEGSDDDADAATREDSAAVDSATQALVAMPDFPEVEAGHLAVLTSADQEDYLFSGSWDATAGRCQEPSLIQVLVQGDGLGIILLFGPSRNADEVGEYEVLTGARGPPDSSVARVGVQLFPDASTRVFRGAAGTAEIQRVDSVVEGRLAVTMIESSFRDSLLLAASFRVHLSNASDEWCQVIGGGRGRNNPSRPVRSRGAPG